MAIYRIQRIYSEENNGQQQKKSGMSTLGKVALGTAVVGGGLLAGKAGMFGTKVQRGIGQGMAWTGNKLGSQTMINSGAKTVGNAAMTDKAVELGIKDTSLKGLSNLKQNNSDQFKQLMGARSSARNEVMGSYKLKPKPVTTPVTTPAPAPTPAVPVQNAFSEDTNKSLREAAIVASGLALTAGGVLAAKHGLLGKSAKEGYNKVSSKIKNLWNGKKPAVESKEAEAALDTIKNAAKKVYSDSDKKKILAEMRSKGLDTHNPNLFEEIAQRLGCTPI